MSTSSLAKLTTKQQRVYDLLQRGEDRKQIAKRLGTTEANVYGHLRKIREAGYSLTNGTTPEVPEPKAPERDERVPLDATSARAAGDAEAYLRAALEGVHNQIETLTTQAAKYEAALAALQ